MICQRKGWNGYNFEINFTKFTKLHFLKGLPKPFKTKNHIPAATQQERAAH